MLWDSPSSKALVRDKGWLMIELSVDAFPSVEPLLKDFQHCIPLNGVLDGKHAGRVFVDDAAVPSSAYVWTPWGYHYLAGISKDGAFLSTLREKLIDDIQPQSAACGEPDILLTLVPEALTPVLVDIMPTPYVVNLHRSIFTFNQSKFLTLQDWKRRIPSGNTIEYIDANLAFQLAEHINATWRSADEFLECGFGYCLLNGSDIVSVCLSAFMARGEVEIGVSTEQDYRWCGYGSLTAAAMIKYCLDNGLSPNWECFWDNKPSIGLANKLGFEQVGNVPIYYWQGPAV